MRHIISLLAFFLCTLIPTAAQTLYNSAGNLSSSIRNPATIQKLTVIGTVNLADFEFIALEMPALKTLDLSGAAVTEYNGGATFTGRTGSEADLLPPYALVGLGIERLTLPAGLKAIGEGALAGTSIKQVTIPSAVTSIGPHAFADCRNLTSIILPAALCEIGEGAFKGCEALESIEINGTPSEIAPYTFAGCSKLRDCNLPFTIRSIGASAFNGCEALQTISFPANLANIGERAFFGCGLRSVDLSSTKRLDYLGDWSFANCPSLTSVSLPSSLVNLGTGTFCNDASLRFTTLPAATAEIPDFTFAGNAGCGTMLENSVVERLGAYSLADWSDVRVFTLPSSVNELKEGAMADWQRLDTIKATALTAVPGTTPSTWGAIDRSGVVLLVSDDCKEMFRTADEWREFKVMTRQDVIDGIDDIITDEAIENVSVRIEGGTLIINSLRCIVAVQFYDIAGRGFSLPVAITGSRCTIDTTAWDATIMIVRVILDNNTAAVFKFAR